METNQHKQTGVAILISHKIDFKAQSTTRDNKTFHNDKREMYQEYKIIISVYVPNNKDLKYIKQKISRYKKKIDTSTIIVKDFDSTFSGTYKTKLKNH